MSMINIAVKCEDDVDLGCNELKKCFKIKLLPKQVSPSEAANCPRSLDVRPTPRQERLMGRLRCLRRLALAADVRQEPFRDRRRDEGDCCEREKNFLTLYGVQSDGGDVVQVASHVADVDGQVGAGLHLENGAGALKTDFDVRDIADGRGAVVVVAKGDLGTDVADPAFGAAPLTAAVALGLATAADLETVADLLVDTAPGNADQLDTAVDNNSAIDSGRSTAAGSSWDRTSDADRQQHIETWQVAAEMLGLKNS